LRRELDFFWAPVERDDGERFVFEVLEPRELDFFADVLREDDFFLAPVERLFFFAAMNYSPVRAFIVRRRATTIGCASR
jgi:hypothetical protein